ncbi:hypothetical protein Y032_0584g313 [Ancylostoma ceylanicum]|uniref:Uncharacterized protein n=1 Tax=Ancylostoma ceylanicum TaxID=53326 RepID=A0A016WNB4_9BILA|nr:hypothetical protein Y032_0584g313 [Ancylostoma ceylanicum]
MRSSAESMTTVALSVELFLLWVYQFSILLSSCIFRSFQCCCGFSICSCAGVGSASPRAVNGIIICDTFAESCAYTPALIVATIFPPQNQRISSFFNGALRQRCAGNVDSKQM